MASLDQFQSNYEAIKLKASLRLAKLKLMLNETTEAFTLLSASILPRIMELDDATLVVQTYLLLAKACIKMALLRNSF